MSERLLFRGARVVDPASGLDEVLDVLVEEGRIAGVGDVASEGATVLESEGLIATRKARCCCGHGHERLRKRLALEIFHPQDRIAKFAVVRPEPLTAAERKRAADLLRG